MLASLRSNLGLALYLAVFAAGGAVTGYVTYKIMHSVVAEQRLEFEHATLVALQKAQAEEARLQTEFDARMAAARLGYAAALKAAMAAADAKAQALQDALDNERKNDAELDRCLSRRLPDSILRNLAR